MSDEELARKFQEVESISDFKGDMELARLLHMEETRKMQDENLVRKLQEEESSKPLLSSMDAEIAHQLQKEENRKHQEENKRKDEDFEKDQSLARQLQEEESTVGCLSSMDEEIARRLQEEERRKHQEEKDKDFERDRNLARQLQQEESSRQATAATSTPIDIKDLQEEAIRRVREIESDTNFARQLQQEEESSNQSLLSTDMGRLQSREEHTDRVVAFQLQQEEYAQLQALHSSSANSESAVMTGDGDRLAQDSPTPPEWETQTQTTEVFPVNKGSIEWANVEQKFEATMPSSQVVSILRIQNSWLWGKYCDHKKRLNLKNNGAVNELELFHGTRGNDPKVIYEGEHGFDMRYSNQGMWGQANYFAVNASYSNRYAYQTLNGCKEMFLVKVLTGESFSCPSNRALRKPPERPSGEGGGMIQLPRMDYDTVTGVTVGSQVYMTYDNDKAYPAYLITYK